MQKIISFILLVSLILTLSVTNTFASQNKPIIIAHVSPTTGRFAVHSDADYRGVKMAVDEYNAQGGVLNRTIILIQQNPTLEKTKAQQVAKDLIEKTKVGFMVGAVDSGVATAMSQVAQEYGVIFINTNSSAPSQSVENAHRTKFVFDANGANYNKTLLKYALDRSKTKNVLLLTEENEWGKSNAAASKPYIEMFDGKIVEEILVPQQLNDPATLIEKIKKIDADVVAVNISGNNQVKLFTAIDPKVFDTQSWVIGEIDCDYGYFNHWGIFDTFGQYACRPYFS